jgi:hypothetical protein
MSNSLATCLTDRFDSSTSLKGVIFKFPVKLSSKPCLFLLVLFHVYRIYQSVLGSGVSRCGGRFSSSALPLAPYDPGIDDRSGGPLARGAKCRWANQQQRRDNLSATLLVAPAPFALGVTPAAEHYAANRIALWTYGTSCVRYRNCRHSISSARRSRCCVRRAALRSHLPHTPFGENLQCQQPPYRLSLANT